MSGSTVSLIVGVFPSNLTIPVSLVVTASRTPIDQPELVLPLILPADNIRVAVGFDS